jgi:hypothetical protein
VNLSCDCIYLVEDTDKLAKRDDWSAAIESWDNAEADEDFWGMDPSEKTNNGSSSTSIGTMSVKRKRIDDWECSGSDDNWSCNERLFADSDQSKLCSQSENTLSNKLYQNSNHVEQVMVGSKNIPSNKLLQNSDHVEQIMGEHYESIQNVENHKINDEKSKQSEFLDEAIFEGKETQQNDVMNTCSDLVSTIPQEKEQKQLCINDPMSLSEEEDGNLFVMEDSDYQSENRKRKWKEPAWRPVVKEDPYFVKEFLYLTLEEVNIKKQVFCLFHFIYQGHGLFPERYI